MSALLFRSSGVLRSPAGVAVKLMLRWLTWLTPAEVQLMADSICHDLRAAMASCETELWRALVVRTFPDTPFSCVAACRGDSERCVATWKELFRLLAAIETTLPTSNQDETDGSQWNKSLCSEIVPVELRAEQMQLRVQVKDRSLNLSLCGTTKSYDGVYLRERVHDVKFLPRRVAPDRSNAVSAGKSKFSARRLKFALAGLVKECDASISLPQKVSEAHHAGVLVLTDSQLFIHSSVAQSVVWVGCLSDVVNVSSTRSTTSELAIEMVQQTISVSMSSPASASGWVTAIDMLKPRCKDNQELLATAQVRLAEQTTDSSMDPRKPAKVVRRGRFSTKLSEAKRTRIRSFTFPISTTISSWLPMNSSKAKIQRIEQPAGGSSEVAGTFAVGKATRVHKTMPAPTCASSRVAGVSLLTPQRRTFAKLQVSFRANWARSRYARVLKRSSLPSLASTTSESSLATEEGGVVPCERSARQIRRSMSSFSDQHSMRKCAPGSSLGSGLSAPGDGNHVRSVVRRLLQSDCSFEGQVCKRVFKRQTQFRDSPSPTICRSYLTKVRGCIQDLVQFMLTFRLAELQEHDSDRNQVQVHQDNQNSHDGDTHYAQGLADKVQFAVEEYFCTSLQTKLSKWCAIVANIPHRAFQRKLIQWSTFSPSRTEFGLNNASAIATSRYMKHAIQKFHDIGVEVTPQRKLGCLMDAVQALHDHIAMESCTTSSTDDNQTSPVSGDADELLPLLIFAVCKSKLHMAFAQGVAMRTLYPFVSQHGECVYYLTMFETSLEFVRSTLD